MKVTREEFGEGLGILATIGCLVAAFVVPGQWLPGHIRTEAKVGMAISTACFVIAAAVAHPPRLRLWAGPFTVIAISSLAYAVVILEATSGKPVRISPNVLRLVVVLLLVVGAVALFAATRVARLRAHLVPGNKSLERRRER
jgi:hypothetical protein